MAHRRGFEVPTTVAGVSDALARLLGDGAVEGVGVRHVCSCFASARGQLHAIRVGERSPRSAADRFLLGASRATADVVVTSGRNVRCEPDLDHALGCASLHPYRAQQIGEAPLRSVVVTRGDALPADHPLWADWTETSVWTGAAHVPTLRARLPSAVKVEAAPEGGLVGAVDRLRDEGARRVSLELGPSAMRVLYAAGVVQALWLAEYAGRDAAPPAVDRAVAGDLWPFDREALAGWRVHASEPVFEPSGRWDFGRYAPTKRSASSTSPLQPM